MELFGWEGTLEDILFHPVPWPSVAQVSPKPVPDLRHFQGVERGHNPRLSQALRGDGAQDAAPRDWGDCPELPLFAAHPISQVKPRLSDFLILR